MPRSTLLLFAVGALLSACDDSNTDPDVLTSVTIEAADSVLPIGGTLAFTALARDDDGDVADVEIEVVSSDPGVASIDGDALIGIEIGYTDVIATVGERADTLRVRVRDDAVPVATARLRFGRGASAVTTAQSTLMRFLDRMGDGAGDQAGLTSQPSGFGRDTVLTIVFRGDEHAGRHRIAAYPLDGSAGVGVTALLRLGSAAGGDLEYFVSVDSGLIDLDLEAPPAAGWRTGTVSGFFDMPLVRIVPGDGGPPVLTADTLWLHGAVHSRYQHVLLGWAEIATLDGPVVGSSVLGQAFAGDDDVGGYIVGMDGDYDGVGGGPARWEVSQELRVLGPSAGTFSFPRFTGDAFYEPSLWPSIFSSVFYRDDGRVPLVVDGTLTITRWLPPALEDYGIIEGTIDARFELWSPDLTTPTGDTIHAVTRFAAPIPPEVGLPAAPPIPESLQPRR